MEILLLLPRLNTGGAEMQMCLLAEGLSAKGHNVHLGVYYNEKGSQYDRFINLRIPIVFFGKSRKMDFFIFYKINKYIRNNNINLVQTFMGNHHSYLSCFFTNAVAIGGRRNSNKLNFNSSVLEYVIPKLLQKYLVVANSLTGLKQVEDHGLACRLIPNGIHVESFINGDRCKVRDELGLEDEFVIGTIGRLVEAKNHPNLIKSIRYLPDNFVLIIVGGGPLEEHLKNIVNEFELNSRVKLTGEQGNIADYLASFDCFVLMSKHEGWPNVVGEAMSAELPVISNMAGGKTEIVEHGKNGYLVNSFNEMLEKIEFLYHNPDVREKLGKAGRDRIETMFSIDKMLERYNELYNEYCPNRS